MEDNMMIKNDKAIIKIGYLKHHSEFQMHYGDWKVLHMGKQKSDKEYLKEKFFYESCGSSQQYVEMLNYALENYSPSEVVIELWSVFDLNIWQFWSIAHCFEVVSTLESKEELKEYLNMIQKFMKQEKDCIVNSYNEHSCISQ